MLLDQCGTSCGCDAVSMMTHGCGSKLNRRGKPQVLVHVSTYQGTPFWNSGFLRHSHILRFVDLVPSREVRLAPSNGDLLVGHTTWRLGIDLGCTAWVVWSGGLLFFWVLGVFWGKKRYFCEGISVFFLGGQTIWRKMVGDMEKQVMQFERRRRLHQKDLSSYVRSLICDNSPRKVCRTCGGTHWTNGEDWKVWGSMGKVWGYIGGQKRKHHMGPVVSRYPGSRGGALFGLSTCLDTGRTG